MRLRLGVALLALAPLPFATTAPAQAITVTAPQPGYLNIVVTATERSPEQQFAEPKFRVERLELRDGDTTLSPRVECMPEFAPRQFFAVTCNPVEEPALFTADVENNQVTVQGRQCVNAGVRASISGPAALEQVTGTITCGEPAQVSASCTAIAALPDVVNGGFSGNCAQVAPEGPFPIRCWVDLTRVHFDRWEVTCYGTDP